MLNPSKSFLRRIITSMCSVPLTLKNFYLPVQRLLRLKTLLDCWTKPVSGEQCFYLTDIRLEDPARSRRMNMRRSKRKMIGLPHRPLSFPKRLIAFCSFNPLKEYALDELARCAKDPNLRHGIKLHFGSSDVQTEIPEHFEKLKKVFQAANSQRMAIIVHMRASISKKRPYGPEQARAFLELLSFAPDIPVQIAHLASSGPGYDGSSGAFGH